MAIHCKQLRRQHQHHDGHQMASTANQDGGGGGSLGVHSIFNVRTVDGGVSGNSQGPSTAFHNKPVYFQQSTLTPYHLLHPCVSPSVFQDYPVAPKPLYRVLALMRQALEVILSKQGNDDNSFAKLVRIEHPITFGSVDPLAWISAQHLRLQTLQSLQPLEMMTEQQPQSTLSYFYCQNQEEDFEVAAFGSVYSCNTTKQVWSYLEDQEACNWPRSSRWYGGQRFDSSLDVIQQSPEWKEFFGGTNSAAWWFLPAIELRRDDYQKCNQTVLAVHVVPGKNVEQTLNLLRQVTDQCMEQRPPTTLPPLLSRSTSFKRSDGVMYDGQELYEEAVSKAIEALDAGEGGQEKKHRYHDPLRKVVLARVQRMRLGVNDFCALAVLRRWKYGGNEGGHLFWMQPCGNVNGAGGAPEFFGCSPERLFRIKPEPGERDVMVLSEALAGTRPRGSTAAEDTQLLRDLMESPKDQKENKITGDYIGRAFSEIQNRGWIVAPASSAAGDSPASPTFFVRRLLHLQHLCQSFKAHLSQPSHALNATRYLLSNLHPTPAVCGAPLDSAMAFIRQYESVIFDRGFYSGPVGYIGLDASDIFVALRSALLTREPDVSGDRTNPESLLSVYAGAGIVPGSTIKGEWAETNFKLAVISSVFPQSPMTLQGAQTPNVAWATAFLEELIRNGVTQFYVCPGSRSTPLVVALSRAARSHVGVIQVTSVHDERSAAFRAIGYGRGATRPAAVITSSGTAVANLYPAVVEAGMDGVPMLLLTADRPYENRDTGANQAIDQVKIFSSTYVRWFRDILPPSDTVPISLVLSDAGHAVNVARTGRGPVHLNIQFRENLAPDGGSIRNDNRADSVTKFNAFHFTETPKFSRWSVTGNSFQNALKSYGGSESSEAAMELSRLILGARRGLIVVGNIRPSVVDPGESPISVADAISDFAQHVGFPIVAGAQQVALRFRSPSVILFAEHLLKSPDVAKNIKPDLVIQLGAPMVSSEIPSIIERSINDSIQKSFHVLINPSTAPDRIDPSFTVTHHINADTSSFLKSVSDLLRNVPGSELTPLVTLGKLLQPEMKGIIQKASSEVSTNDQGKFSEPEVILAMAESYTKRGCDNALFLSNSMPIRDSEFFLYPLSEKIDDCVIATGSNRGASGIDGIISSAVGFAEATGSPTTLIIGDVSALHDIGSLHKLGEQAGPAKHGTGKRHHPLTTVVVNNDGGGIFSFLPIAKHGNDVSFDEFFGTPTRSFSFEKGASAFGLPYRQAYDYKSFLQALSETSQESASTLVEAMVMSRESNVLVHRRIFQAVASFVGKLLGAEDNENAYTELSRVKTFSSTDFRNSTLGDETKTVVLIHGWMGDKYDWDEIALSLSVALHPAWSIKAVDLTGHGESSLPQMSSKVRSIRRSLKMGHKTSIRQHSVRDLADGVCKSLASQGVQRIDALVGYSLGGRVALAMYDGLGGNGGLVHNETKLVLLSSYSESHISAESPADTAKKIADDKLAERIHLNWCKSLLIEEESTQGKLIWDQFLEKWYSAPIWAGVQSVPQYTDMKKRRSNSLETRGPELAGVVSGCSPPRNKRALKGFSSPANVLVVAGALDRKYCGLGVKWCDEEGIDFAVIPSAGHAVMLEQPLAVSEKIACFLSQERLPSRRPIRIHTGEVAAPTERGNGLPGSDSRRCVIEYQRFSLKLLDSSRQKNSVSGIGWGDEAKKTSKLSFREGLVIQVEIRGEGDDLEVGVGEIAPLRGLHSETLEMAVAQIEQVISAPSVNVEFDPLQVLQLNGYISGWFEREWPDIELLPSVRAGLEMALLGLSANKLRIPIHQAILREAANTKSPGKCSIELNGLVTRGSFATEDSLNEEVLFRSLKVKVGHQDTAEDVSSLRLALSQVDSAFGPGNGKLRLDANRAWNWTQALDFSTTLDTLGVKGRIEFIEEPLLRTSHKSWSLIDQVAFLEKWFLLANIPYALDESIADLVLSHEFQFRAIEKALLKVFQNHTHGCTAIVLKPALLGMELSMQIARLAKQKLGISAVFSSSFDSGIGLAYTAFIAAASDAIDSKTRAFAHGLGTFRLLDGDILSPSFSSYVSDKGLLNIAPVSRAMYSLTLDELHVERDPSKPTANGVSGDEFGGPGELSTIVTLPLPFSAETATSRFTDLPQQPRWSPWLSSVSYHGKESEWKINVRGISLKWRATSQLLEYPWPGIQWQSVSGVANRGTVEFIPTGSDSCEMKVRITFNPPRILTPLFRKATSIFLEDFIRDKIIKWSLEMFRDVVKADLAIERGDVELGDALIGAVEGKANAIEATLQRSTTNED